MDLSTEFFTNYFIDRFPSCSWGIGVLKQLDFVILEFSFPFQVSQDLVNFFCILKLTSNAAIYSRSIKFVCNYVIMF